jgi:CTP:molybdopterin cytidylyltransferase MocA
MGILRHAGIVLAAGASSRMGSPKALLPLPDGHPLAVEQADLLREAGCSPVHIVLGSVYEQIAPVLKDFKLVRNTQWQTGRMSSVAAGLQALEAFDGCLILPVDTVGVRPQTLELILRTADAEHPAAVRPYYEGKAGNVLWLSQALADDIHLIDSEQDKWPARMDEAVDPLAHRVDVDDPAILHNVNTREEWEEARESY